MDFQQIAVIQKIFFASTLHPADCKVSSSIEQIKLFVRKLSFVSYLLWWQRSLNWYIATLPSICTDEWWFSVTILKKTANLDYHDIIRWVNHCVKSVQIRRFFWSEYRKIRTRKNSIFGYFSCSQWLILQWTILTHIFLSSMI